jgi:hypothetical protein
MTPPDLLLAADSVLMASKKGTARVAADARAPTPSPGIESAAEHC